MQIAGLFAMATAPLTSLLLFRDSLSNSSSSTAVMVMTYFLWNAWGLFVIYAVASGRWGKTGDDGSMGVDGKIDVFGLRGVLKRYVSRGKNGKRFEDDPHVDFEAKDRVPWAQDLA